MLKLTQDQIDTYAKMGGVDCPYCGVSGYIYEQSRHEFDSPTIWQDVRCHSCGREWIDKYQLVGLSEVDDLDNELPL